MCGILGQYVFAGSLAPRDMLESATHTLAHRGPDDATSWSAGPFFFGHRRLSIIDLADGRQPMATADGSLVVILNGEIYNYLELKDELIASGYRFRTASDTEVLLHGYKAWREKLPEKLVGMFAFAVADREREELFLSRDRFGEKPLFYWEGRGGVSFASEIKGIAALPGFPREPNWAALPSYLCLNYVPGEDTLMSDVRRLSPATWRRYGRRGFQDQQAYWKPPPQKAGPASLAEAADRLESMIDHSVRIALRSDVPVGIFLSGGIDSSIVARSAARSGRLSRAYCLAFEEEGYSEWEMAQRTAVQLGIPIERVILRPESIQEFLKLVEHADDPLADSSALAVWVLAREAARQNKVVLSGDGGDELFGGYLTYRATLLHETLVSGWPRSLRSLLRRVADRLPTSESKVSASYKLMRFLRAADRTSAAAHYTWNGAWLPEQAARLLRSEALQSRAMVSLDEMAARHGLPSRPTLGDLQRADIADYLPNDILAKVDRMSMAHGLEVRAPFLEPNLAGFALSLPSEWKVAGAGITKRILRVVAERSYGVTLAHAPKQGFSIPVHAWLRGPGRAIAEDLLAPASVARLGVLDEGAVSSALQAHMGGRSCGFEIWGLMVLVAWHRARVERRTQAMVGRSGIERIVIPYHRDVGSRALG